EMKSLQIRAVVIVQLFGEEQAEVFVAPCQSAHVRGNLVHLVLKLGVVLVSGIVFELFEKCDSLEQLVPVTAGNFDGLIRGNVLRLVGLFAARLPVAGFLPTKDSELQGAATSDAAKLRCLELVVVL